VAISDSQSGTQSDSTGSLVEVDLTPEMIELYEKRLENGYDIYTDASYVAWLEKFHPEHVPHLGKILIFKKLAHFFNRRCDTTTE